jgi:SAM-dependent methyltransferase
MRGACEEDLIRWCRSIANSKTKPVLVRSESSATIDAGTSAYYDRLSRWTGLMRWIGYSGGRDVLCVHRALADPRSGGRLTRTRVHDVLMDALQLPKGSHVLDAGCGLGGTMIEFASSAGANCVGLTLSRSQAVLAERAARQRGLEARIRVHVGTYDRPLPGPFDLALAVESLAHSADPAASVTALVNTLSPHGLLAIVDDMPMACAAGTTDLASFKRGWQAPVLWSRDQYKHHLSALGMTILEERDLTPECRPRTLRRIEHLRMLNRLAKRVVPLRAFRDLMESYEGGLALERLFRTGGVQYRLLVAGKHHSAGRRHSPSTSLPDARPTRVSTRELGGRKSGDWWRRGRPRSH